MALDLKSIERPLRKLRKALKGFSRSPSPKAVHSLRGQARRMEAIVDALQLNRRSIGEDVVDALRPIRKAAGTVRDMDVLLSLSASLEHEADDECMVELLELLAKRRAKAAKKLYKVVASCGDDARSALKRYGRLLENSEPAQQRAGSEPQPVSLHTMAVSLQLEKELGKWPKASQENLHPLRLKVKKLHYILKLADGASPAFVESLGKVKDQIGTWHDWLELFTTAKPILKSMRRGSLLDQIYQRVMTEFARSVDVTNGMRSRYINAGGKKARGKKHPDISLGIPVIEATSRLVN